MLQSVIDYMSGKNKDSEIVRRFNSAIEQVKANPGWRSDYMDFQDMLAEEREEGIELGRSQGIELGKSQGIELGTITGITNIMKNARKTYEEACIMLGLTPKQMRDYKDKVVKS